MARYVSPANLAALQARRLVARDFLWIVARERATGALVPDGMWSDVGSVNAPVLNPDTGVASNRDFFGAGGLVSISDIPSVTNITVQTVTITMSQVDDHVAELVRFYDVKQARVEIYRGLFDPDTRKLVDPAVCRFVGFVDKVVIRTPSENEDGSVSITCVSHTQELRRSNPDTRSHESQKLRSASDDFFVDASVVGEWEHFWGKTAGAIVTAPAQKKGIFGLGGFLGIF